MDEREVDKQPEEEPRETPVEPIEEQDTSPVDSARDGSAEDIQAEQAAASETPEEPEGARAEQEAAPADRLEEPSDEQRDDIVGEAPPSEIPELLASEAAEEVEVETRQAVPEEAEEEVPVERSRSSSERRGGQLAQGEMPPEVSSEPAWYVIHCYSGYENKVRHNLEQRIETMGMKDKIFDVVIPTQEE